jgi:hypothetical protein
MIANDGTAVAATDCGSPTTARRRLRQSAYGAPTDRWLGQPAQRAQARVGDGIRTRKDSGFGRFPSRLFAINAAWLELALVGIDLLAWTQVLVLGGEHQLAEPTKLRYRLLHVATRPPRYYNLASEPPDQPSTRDTEKPTHLLERRRCPPATTRPATPQ